MFSDRQIAVHESNGAYSHESLKSNIKKEWNQTSKKIKIKRAMWATAVGTAAVDAHEPGEEHVEVVVEQAVLTLSSAVKSEEEVELEFNESSLTNCWYSRLRRPRTH